MAFWDILLKQNTSGNYSSLMVLISASFHSSFIRNVSKFHKNQLSGSVCECQQKFTSIALIFTFGPNQMPKLQCLRISEVYSTELLKIHPWHPCLSPPTARYKANTAFCPSNQDRNDPTTLIWWWISLFLSHKRHKQMYNHSKQYHTNGSDLEYMNILYSRS